MSNIEKMISEMDKVDNQIFALNQTISAKLNALQSMKAEIKEELDNEIAQQVSGDLSANDYGCGTANIDTANHKIKVVVSKKVKWDEAVLRNVASQIKTAGQDPENFIKYKLSVSETAYKGFTEDIQQAFEPAREVTPSAPKITIERK